MKETINLQTDLLEKLSTHIERIEDFMPEMEKMSKEGLIISTDFDVEPYEEDRGIRKTPIVWPLFDYKMFYTVEVPSKTTIPKHSHDEAVFRVLISGSLELNGRKIDKPGTWYVVPSFTEYEIKTDNGYVVISAYIHNCRTGRQQALKEKVTAPQG